MSNTEKSKVNHKIKETPSQEYINQMSDEDLMQQIYQPPRDTIKTIGFLVYDGFFMLDAMGPYSVLSSLASARKILISPKDKMVTSSDGITIQTQANINEIDQLDILVIPGGILETYKASKDTILLDWIKKIDRNSKYTTSVCTGAWILGAAGLLNEKKATTNWFKAKENLNQYGATFVKERYVQDGKYWTSAGVSAGIDMSLALIKHIAGENYAAFTALNLEYDPDPPFEGGHPDKTDPLIVEMTERAYGKLINQAKKDLNP